MKSAIIEFWPFHEEVIPSHIYYLNNFGSKPDVYINEISLKNKGNIFSLYNNLSYDLYPRKFSCKQDWDDLSEIINYENYDFVVINTFQTEGSGWSTNLKAKKLCIVHNPVKFYKNRKIFDIAAREKDIHLLTLGPVSATSLKYLLSMTGIVNKEVNYFFPTVFPKLFLNTPKKFDIAMVGGVDYRNRNYLDAIKIALINSVSIKVVGGGVDLERLKIDVHKYKAEEFFSFTIHDRGMSNYKDMFTDIASSNFLLTSFHEPCRYHYNAISSVINYAIGFEIPLLQDSVTKKLYDVPGPIYFKNLFKIDNSNYHTSVENFSDGVTEWNLKVFSDFLLKI